MLREMFQILNESTFMMFSPSIKDYYTFALLSFSSFTCVYINAVALKQQNKRDTCAHMEATRERISFLICTERAQRRGRAMSIQLKSMQRDMKSEVGGGRGRSESK